MKYFGDDLSNKHKELSKIIRNKTLLDASKSLFMEVHSKLHQSEGMNEIDKLFADLNRHEYEIIPTSKGDTIAWILWHITRIEDLTMNILVSGNEQILNNVLIKKLNVTVTDTGNAMTYDEEIEFSRNVNIDELHAYRKAVGERTEGILLSLSADDMRRKISPERIARIKECGGVTDNPDSIWLLDYWGSKDVAGLLLMPPTRHLIVHLNECFKIKEQIRSKKKYYREA